MTKLAIFRLPAELICHILDFVQVVQLPLFAINVHPCDEKHTLSRNVTRIRREGRDLRYRYARFVVVLVTT